MTFVHRRWDVRNINNLDDERSGGARGATHLSWQRLYLISCFAESPTTLLTKLVGRRLELGGGPDKPKHGPRLRHTELQHPADFVNRVPMSAAGHARADLQ